ncbi:MBL fold metallo-hydrolase [Brevibacillus ruminantium]|uniref:MBL fold metallo-hydrolase n=1 Tax=Brevibacillus ruminantium TaxID=2950604 RepID=A0ABY4WET1_9BACL|nr:MBL fold metallo-hydrolase [Brevibacillus ruminantium]USG65655.1 MBL fold metallo-hydrolase [Brevibacillus ruminantium]
MEKRQPIDLGHGIQLIDGFDLGLENRTGTYVMQEEELTLIETSASPSVPHILAGLSALGLDPADVKYVIVTHIHLDHAGGAGLLLQEHCPQAKVVVHPKGARHLVDPSRLIMGARAVYGDKFDQFFEPIIPVPEQRVLIKGHEETLQIGPSRVLRFFDSPGHAYHHCSIYDPVSNGMFTGDTLGVQYSQLKADGVSLYLPSTSPNQFDPEAMLHSLAMVQEMQVERIFFGHFGMSTEVEEVYRQLTMWIPRFVQIAEAVAASGDLESSEVSRQLLAMVASYLKDQGIAADHPEFGILRSDLEICAMGLVDYLQKKQ